MALTCGDNGSTGQQVITQINKNETDIATNASDIQINADDIQELRNLVDFAKDSNSNILNIGETYTPVASLSVNLSPGQYSLYMSATYTFTSINTSVFEQLTLNGVNEQFQREPSDITDRIPEMYGFPLDWPGGVYDVTISFRKENASGVLDVLYASLWISKEDELLP